MLRDSSKATDQEVAKRALQSLDAPAPRKTSPHGIVGTTFLGLVLYLVPPTLASIFLLGVFAIVGYSVGELAEWVTEGPIGQFWYVFITDSLMILLLAGFLKLTQESWRSIGLIRPNWRVIRFIIVGFLLYYALYLVVALVVNEIVPLDFDQRQEIGFDTNISGIPLLLAGVSLVVLPPLVEETVFRGFLYTRFRRAAPRLAAAVLVSILFAIAHLQFGSSNPLLWVAALDTFVLSLVLVWLREKTGSIWAGVGVHALKNGLAFMLLFIVGM